MSVKELRELKQKLCDHQIEINRMVENAIDLAAQIEKLEVSARAEKWEPRGGLYGIYGNGDIKEINKDSHPQPESVQNGYIYPDMESAEKSRDAMRPHNRLLAYVREFDSDWTPDFSNAMQVKCFITYNEISGQWARGSMNGWPYMGTVYMSYDCAEDLVIKLNKGEVEL